MLGRGVQHVQTLSLFLTLGCCFRSHPLFLLRITLGQYGSSVKNCDRWVNCKPIEIRVFLSELIAVMVKRKRGLSKGKCKKINKKQLRWPQWCHLGTAGQPGEICSTTYGARTELWCMSSFCPDGWWVQSSSASGSVGTWCITNRYGKNGQKWIWDEICVKGFLQKTYFSPVVE